ncbi:Crp/Fnr family transcriptional regulator [Geoalkalibacter halelectricus]|uniref:Crp/Fnr family transcriptional regulator n=1 Tax=Geoalkalibacter halelectricus TaxID=2847045 RepID=A0ABY5ZQW1_9BACT|nr:Crp/Fnr family transcriptional regulator [Geoalkalibacter halelectricus]MDO3376867.1 Crp/Fnr family transcriptional regulator [Geoalkalibacter halelectricus]UWZ79611.1 Crp/Fnr family transcriptional regulator [Geoalkalibacter halelectricus]
MEPRLWYIRNADMFSWLREDEQMELAKRSEMVTCKRNSRFFFAEEPSDNIFLVKQGRVKLLRASPEGREIILDILGPGEIFGELALTGEERRSHSAEALDDAMVCIIARKDFEELLRRHPEMALRVLKLIGLRRRELEMRLEDLVFQPLAGRLAITLMWQAQRLGVTEGDGSIRIPLAQKDLAFLIGASREAVAEQLSEMKRLGLVKTSYRTIRIIDQSGLKNFVRRHSYEATHT